MSTDEITHQNCTDTDQNTDEPKTLFKQQILFVIAGFETGRYRNETYSNDVAHGLAIKSALEEKREEEVNHGRLYPNLDELIDAGLIEKSELDKRTNRYELTEAGWAYIRAEHEWERSCLSESEATEPEGDGDETPAPDGGTTTEARVNVDPAVKAAVDEHEHLHEVADELGVPIGEARVLLIGAGLYGEIKEGGR